MYIKLIQLSMKLEKPFFSFCISEIQERTTVSANFCNRLKPWVHFSRSWLHHTVPLQTLGIRLALGALQILNAPSLGTQGVPPPPTLNISFF